MNPPEHDIRVDYDDHPEEVAEKFVNALAKHGIKIDYVPGDNDEDNAPYMYYKIVPPDVAAPLTSDMIKCLIRESPVSPAANKGPDKPPFDLQEK